MKTLAPTRAMGGISTLKKTAMGIALGVGLMALTASTVVASPSQSAGELAADSFPIRHMSISNNGKAPANTVWVTVDDGTASGQRAAQSKAIPLDGSVREFGYDEDPNSDTCLDAEKYNQPCWTSWMYVTSTQEARAFASWKGQSCVLIGSREPNVRTKINCEGEEQVIR